MSAAPNSALSTQHSALKVGVQLHPQHCTYRQFRDAVLRMEEIGVDTIWNWDHFYPLYGDPDGPALEGYTVLAAMAEMTSRAAVACMVTCNSYRNPALLSKMATTIDHISNGRFILGIGAGWFEREYHEYGYEFGTATTRLHDLEAALPVIKQRWAKDNPPPVRGTIPILIGGEGEKITLRITAQYADAWNGFGGVDNWTRKSRVLDEWCQKLGRDPSEIERTASIGGEDLANLDGLAAAGCTHVILGFGPPFDPKPVERLVAWRDQRNRAGARA
jgi:probable F420-dependent oxidoreductase